MINKNNKQEELEMADMNSLLGNSEAYYDPSADAPSMVPEGMYKAYAKTLKEREVL